MTILLIFTILVSGMLASTYQQYLKKENFNMSAFLKNSLIYAFMIHGTNVFLIQLVGGQPISDSYNMAQLVKYLAWSGFLSVCYPSIFFLCKYWIKKRSIIITLNGSRMFVIVLLAWIITTMLSITLCKNYVWQETSQFLQRFFFVFCYIGMLIFSAWYLFRKIHLDKSTAKRRLIMHICITLLFLLVVGCVILFALVKGIVEMPGIISTNRGYEWFWFMLFNITFGLFVISFLDYLKNKHLKVYGRCQTLYFILFPMLSFVMIEIFIESEVYSQFIYFFGNLLIYYSLFFILHSIIRSRKLVMIIFNTFCFVFGVVDYFVYHFRGTPILPADIWSWKTAASVASAYRYGLSLDFMIAMTLFLIQMVIIAFLYEKKKNRFHFKLYIRNVVLCIFAAGLCIFILAHGIFEFEVNKWDKMGSYKSNGTALCMYNDVIASWVEKPEGYSSDKIEAISKETDITQASTVTEKEPPNIIVVMNEAFSDLGTVRDLQTSEDYMPFIHSLTEDTIKGQVLVSVYGGNTCNTEFEFLTGNSMAFLPLDSIPFQQYVTKRLDTISTILQGQNYTTAAIHPYSKYGWRRSQVYPLLGLDTFYSKVDFTNPTLLRGYVSDKDSFDKIKQTIDQNKNSPNFIFNVTMQNHGGYSGDAELDNWIELTDSSLAYPKLEEYLTLVHTTDAAFEELITYYKSIETPTIILMFGDHQPSMDLTTSDYLYGNIGEATLAEQQKKYMTPFLIWANYDIEEKQDEMLSANYLSSYLLNIAKVKTTKYNNYLLELQQRIPAINSFGYLGDDGNWYDFDEETAYSKDILEYQYLQYNNLFDSENRNNEFFELTE